LDDPTTTCRENFADSYLVRRVHLSDTDDVLPGDISTLLPLTAEFDHQGRLLVGGCALADVAEQFGTPAFVVDELALRETARQFREALLSWHAPSRVCFASKAFPCTPVLRVIAESGLGCDVAGRGELEIALAAGMDPALIVVHGNAKTDEELQAALAAGVGLIVIDGPDDLSRLERLGAFAQPVLLRVNPGVRVHTHAALATGHARSKFGVPFEAAPGLLRALERSSAVSVRGLHMHLGSQLTDLDAFAPAVERLAELGRFDVYDFGGGLGVSYELDERVPSIEHYAEYLAGLLHRYLGRDAELLIEPGRSLVAHSTLTVYRVVTVKREGPLTFVAVDGGMADNLEAAVYGTRFTPVALTSRRPVETCELVGRQCESGDVLVSAAQLPVQEPGDLIALPLTGGYCYSLLSNYNGALRPPVVFCAAGEATLRVRRETYADLLARDVVLESSAPHLEETKS
jgi:diaminopimelate decarboxylase